MNYVITTMPTNLHAGLSPSLSVIWWQGDALLLSAWHLEPYVPPNESAISERWFPKGFRTGAAVKSSEREDSQSLRSLSQLCSEAEKCRDRCDWFGFSGRFNTLKEEYLCLCMFQALKYRSFTSHSRQCDGVVNLLPPSHPHRRRACRGRESVCWIRWSSIICWPSFVHFSVCGLNHDTTMRDQYSGCVVYWWIHGAVNAAEVPDGFFRYAFFLSTSAVCNFGLGVSRLAIFKLCCVMFTSDGNNSVKINSVTNSVIFLSYL